jgi:cysteine-rich repeat protein
MSRSLPRRILVLLLIACAGAGLFASTLRASCGVGVINTIAGGPGEGPPTLIGLTDPTFLAARGSSVFVVGLNRPLIRALDTATGLMTVVAGRLSGGPLTLGVPAQETFLIAPSDMAFDAEGNLYVADAGGGRVLRIDAVTTVISSVAGDGIAGFGGDGGPSTTARLGAPRAIAFDAAGNLFIAEEANRRIRRVDGTTGIITTVAGNGQACTAVTYPCGDGGLATAAALDSLNYLAVDAAGNVFFTEWNVSNRVRRVDAVTGVVTTIAGAMADGFAGDGGPATAALFNLPLGLTFDAGGNLYVADTENGRVRRIDPLGVTTTVAGGGGGGDGGLATAANIPNPVDVALDAAGNLYIADRITDTVRRVDAFTDIITTVAGNGTPDLDSDGAESASAQIIPERLLAAGNDIVFVEGPRVRKAIGATGLLATVAGSLQPGFAGDGGPATAAQLRFGLTLAMDGAGALYIADPQNNRVRKVAAGSGVITTVVGTGVICDPPSDACGDGSLATAARIGVITGAAFGVAADAAGNLFVGDSANHRIRRIDAGTGIITTVAGTGTLCPTSTSTCGDGGAATSALLLGPSALAFDAAGNLYFADSFASCNMSGCGFGSGRVRRIDAATGVATTIAGSGGDCASEQDACGDGGPATSAKLGRIRDLAVGTSGQVYVLTDRLRVVGLDGRIRTIAGGGDGSNASLFLANGIPATATVLEGAQGLTLEPDEDALVAMPSSRRIRRVSSTLGCGNCVVDAGETCDDGNVSNNDACKADCTLNVCGDGAVYGGVEVCDDGGLLPGDGCAADCTLELEDTGTTAVAGATIVTTGSDATAADPIESAVQTPTGTTSGTVQIVEQVAPPVASPGFMFLGTTVSISVALTPAPTPTDPLRLIFRFHSSLVPADQDSDTIVVLKDGVPVPECTSLSGAAEPDPCVDERERDPDGDVVLTILTTGASDWTFAASICGGAPRSDCIPAGSSGSVLSVRSASNAAADRLSWRWKSAGAVPVELFGDPDLGDDITLCLYGATGQRSQFTAPGGGTCAGQSCWATINGGFSYDDRELSPMGVKKVKLKSGDGPGRAKLIVKGKGTNLTLPSLPLILPARVQLRSAAGVCWDARYQPIAVRRNDPGSFSGKSE